MAIFNAVPSQDQLLGATYRNLAGLTTGKTYKRDDEAYYALAENPVRETQQVFGFPNLHAAASYFITQPSARIGTMDTDGVLVRAERKHFHKKCEAIKAVVLPSLFPAHGRLEQATDQEGLSTLGNLIKRDLLQLLGISISSSRLPRQPEIKRMYQEVGAKDYICALPRNEIPLSPKLSTAWQDFLAKMEEIKGLTNQAGIEYSHFFDIIAPIKSMAFNNGEEGVFARWVGNMLQSWGLQVETALVEFNPYFPANGQVMRSDLQFKDIT